MSLWTTIDSIGVDHGTNPTERRYIEICNRVSFILFVLIFILISIAIAYFRWITSTQLGMVVAFAFLLPLLMNNHGFFNASRFVLIILIILPTLIISILDKFDHPGTLEEFEYFQFRFILIGSTILPFILFSLKEKKQLSLGLCLAIFSIVFYDPLHNYFNAGYYQVGFTAPNYYFLNYIIVFTAMVLIGSTYFLKYSFEKSERENELLIHQLSERQREILMVSESLAKQREQLSQENRALNSELIEKNQQLTETNQELIKHNNELQQFSYTISHNLKGPVASMTGLLQLMDADHLNQTNKEIMDRLASSIKTLDGTIRDLSNIIDIRNDITRIRQKLSLDEELNIIKTLLKKEIDENNVSIQSDFSMLPHLYSVKPMLESILYNLVSNAIKYRSPERDSVIKISSRTIGTDTQLEIEDNGLGIDMGSFGEKVFGLYKRFHTHTEGKGLGLFLVKLQVEALDGAISIESKLDSGTKFTLTFPEFKDVEEQVLLDNDIATISFNASLDSLACHWKRVGTREESIDLLQTCIDFVKAYHTPNWISNMIRVMDRNEDELNEFRRKFREDLKKAGLKRICLILPEGENENFLEERSLDNVYDVEIHLFRSLKEAKDWLAVH
ncbi:MAG: HAMP domain-containing sensor histidine kinase [Cyclobacteriaceae bacterium]